jgi:GTPase
MSNDTSLPPTTHKPEVVVVPTLVSSTDDELGDLITIANYSDSENIPESDEGNHEYKYSLDHLTEERFDHYSVQMQYRLNEGQGQAFYTLGIRDDGYPLGLSKDRLDKSLKNLSKLAKTNSAMLCYVHQKEIPNQYKPKKNIPYRTSNSGLLRHDNIDLMENEDHQQRCKLTKRERKQRRDEKKLAMAAKTTASVNVVTAVGTAGTGDPAGATDEADAAPVEETVNCCVKEGNDIEEKEYICGQTSSSDSEPLQEVTQDLGEEAQDERVSMQLFMANILIRKINKDEYVDIRIGIGGSVDAGKSTTIGVLTRGTLDNGRGSARANVFNHKHEIETGRTSSISQQIMGFNQEGNSVNDLMGRIHTPAWEDIVHNSNKIITFFDLAGHEKYLKTTIVGLSTHKPDYCLILVGANMGHTHMTIEHINLCLTYKIPFIVLVTKVDMSPPNILAKTHEDINKLLKERGRTCFHVKTTEDMINMSQQLKEDVIVPIMEISNVKGTNIQLLKDMLNLLPKRRDDSSLRNEPVKYLVHEGFTVKGAGTVVSGYLVQGTVHVGDRLLLGPDGTNKFIPTQVKSIHSKKVNVMVAYAGQNICFSLRNVNRNDIRKGTVLLASNYVPSLRPLNSLLGKSLENSDSLLGKSLDNSDGVLVKSNQSSESLPGNPNNAMNTTIELKGHYEFEAEIAILKNHSTCIRNGYAPIIHVDNARQAAQIMQIIDVQFSNKRQAGNTDELRKQPISADEQGNPIYVKGRLPKNFIES